LNDIDPGTLRAALPAWVPEVRYLEATDSTNRQAMAWAREGAPHGALVLADFQTAGRGRLGRSWVAPPGSSLLFSAVLRPGWEPGFRPLLTLAAAAAICECLSDLGFDPGLKWPNDVLLADRKVAGILAEAAGDVVILGLGVNVGQAEFPPDIAQSATSLQLCSGRKFDRLEVLTKVVGYLAELVDGPAAAIPERYRRWSLTLGSRVRVVLTSGSLEDRAVDIDPAGGLMLEGGQVVRAGDVFQVR
jgi:BirA family transcriptional regulator, biotin operon repressor / biotin---[acetyl-CoA-carboxylase] ligase